MVRKIIDLECLLPPDEQGRPRQYHEQASHRIGYGDPELLEPRPGYGFANYQNIFRKRVAGPGKSQGEKKPVGQSINEALAMPQPADTWAAIADIRQARRRCLLLAGGAAAVACG